MPLEKAQIDLDLFNPSCILPYELRREDIQMAMQDVYDLLFDLNTAMVSRGLKRMEETVRPAIFSGMMSDALTAGVSRHARVLTENLFHNGHPDLIPDGRYADNKVQAGADGVEVKATKGTGAVDLHGARRGWLLVFRWHADVESEPVVDREPTRIYEVLLAELEEDDFRRNDRGELGTRTASPNAIGLKKLRENWIYREPDVMKKRQKAARKASATRRRRAAKA